MDILWRISIKEENTDDLATPFSGKFGDDLDSVDKIHERMKEIKEMAIKLRESTSTVDPGSMALQDSRRPFFLPEPA